MRHSPLPPGDQPPAPLAMDISPANQCFPPPASPRPTTSSASAINSNGEEQRKDLRSPQKPSAGVTVTPSSAPLVNSNGEVQRLETNLHRAASSGVTATPSSTPATTLSGDNWQRLDLRPPTRAEATGTGLATEVAAGSANPTMLSPPSIVACSPPAVTRPADTTTKTGLPTNVFIR